MVEGMLQCNDIVYDTMKRVRQSLEDVYEIHVASPLSTEGERHARELMFAVDTLLTFYNLFSDAFDRKMGELKRDE